MRQRLGTRFDRVPGMIRGLLIRIGWGPTVAAEKMSVNERTVRRWIDGTTPCPARVLAYLDAVARAVEGVEVPRRD